MKPQKDKDLDATDLALLKHLKANGRLALSELAQLVAMSAPSVADRIRRLEARGILSRFSIDIELPALGFELEAIVRIKPLPGQLHRVEAMIIEQDRFTACDKVTGEDCFVARLSLRSISELDDLLESFHDRAETNTAIIKSSPVKGRIPGIGD